MNLFVIFLFLLVVFGVSADKCDVCKSSVKDIKNGKGLEYMANLTQEQIDSYIHQNVQKNCDSSDCSKLIKALVEIADQLDDDLDSTPLQLCQFIYQCP